MPIQYTKVREGVLENDPEALIKDRIKNTIDEHACKSGGTQYHLHVLVHLGIIDGIADDLVLSLIPQAKVSNQIFRHIECLG